ncbi:Nickel/cobalt transporter regulator [Paraburkholderia unamae]|uniref:RcnB family protein n=1 Tax=Paraburkholderia unamae TaxID=219649 RepID=UPI001CB09784|nr:RcnB family protein [Paraburkholderia unamae]CAG9244964.1 Nickel/cobalt transporter regulator [Paraburkholderia unamae]
MKSKVTTLLVIAALLATTSSVFAAQPGHGPASQANPSIERANRAVGAIPHQDWHRGDRLPPEYRDRIFVVDDWRQHGLEAPARGYHWVGVAGDYVLVASATGVISKVLPGGAR